jgi:hypothetical protein
MRFTVIIAVVVLSAAPFVHGQEIGTTPLELERALPVEGPDNCQPSGLAILDGELFTVSDKHPDVIFKIVLGDETAKLEPFVTFVPPDGWRGGNLDLEGLAVAPEGGFYLASEKACRVIYVIPEGGASRWVTSELKGVGGAAGLFRKSGGGIEGVAVRAPGKLVVCAERSDRGLIEIDTAAGPPAVKATNCGDSRLHYTGKRQPDFSDLFAEGGVLFALHRNAEVVSEIEIADGRPVEKNPWSYHDAIDSAGLGYSDTTYGIGEGLALDAARVYLILDNNGDHRAGDAGDARPLLLIFKRPGTGGELE